MKITIVTSNINNCEFDGCQICGNDHHHVIDTRLDKLFTSREVAIQFCEDQKMNMIRYLLLGEKLNTNNEKVMTQSSEAFSGLNHSHYWNFSPEFGTVLHQLFKTKKKFEAVKMFKALVPGDANSFICANDIEKFVPYFQTYREPYSILEEMNVEE